MITIHVLLFILSLICFLLSAFGVASRVNLQSLGLAFWILASLLVGVVR